MERGASSHKSRKRRSTRYYNNISKGSIRRLARRGGARRLSALIYNEVRDVLRLFLRRLIHDSVAYCDCSKRKTVTIQDVIFAVKRQGKRIYGFEDA